MAVALTACPSDVIYLTLDSPPEIQATAPVTNAVEVPLDEAVVVIFSEAINGDSIEGALSVSSEGTTATGVLGAVGSTLTFTPTEPYVYASDYTATVSPTVRDLTDDLALGTSYQWTFSTRDLWFTTAREISLSSTEPAPPSLSVVSRNSALATWHRFDGIRYDVLTSEYSDGGWSPPQVIDTTMADVVFPVGVIDGTGTATVAWAEVVGGCNEIWAARNSGAGWDLPVRIENNSCNAGLPSLAANSQGVVVATWQATNGTVISAWANRYVPGSGWQTAAAIEQEANSVEQLMDIAADDGGNAIVVFQTYDGSRYNVFASRFVPGSGWTATPLETTTDNAQNARIAMSPGGNAVIVWEQGGGAVPDIVFATFTPGVGYSTPALVEGDETFSVYQPDVAVAPNGDAVAVWARGTAGDLDIEVAFLSSSSSSWSAPVKLEVTSAAAREPRVAIDSRGFATVAWRQFDGIRYSAWAARFSPSSGWGPATPLESDSGTLEGVAISVGADGYGFVVWSQTSGSADRIRANALR